MVIHRSYMLGNNGFVEEQSQSMAITICIKTFASVDGKNAAKSSQSAPRIVHNGLMYTPHETLIVIQRTNYKK